MGNTTSSTLAAESVAAAAKQKLDATVSDYLEFLELTSAQIDVDIEDLGHEIATVTTSFRVSDELKAVSAEKQHQLQEDVEKHANLHKFAVRRCFGVLEEAYETFEDMCCAITLPDDDDDEDLINFDDYEPSDEYEGEGEDEDEEEDEAEEEASLPSDDDEEDDDYNTAAAEEELAAEMDSEEEDEESDDESDVEDDMNGDEDDDLYSDYEEVVSDEEVLYSARIACTHFVEQFETEMRDVGLPADLITARSAMLRRMLYKAAEAHVADAVSFFVSSYRNAALEDIDNLLCLGMTSGALSSEDPEDVRSCLRNIITVNAVARHALDDLPFTQREAVDAAGTEIAERVHEVIRRVQLLNIDRPRVLEMLMDLDLDDFGSDSDEDLDDVDDSDDSDNTDDDEEEERAVVVAAAAGGRGKATKPVAAPSPKQKATPANKAAPVPRGKAAAAAAAAKPAMPSPAPTVVGAKRKAPPAKKQTPAAKKKR